MTSASNKPGAAVSGGTPRVRAAARPPIETVGHVDLRRFMGKWFVIANIPTPIESGAYNAVERYRLSPDGTIDTTFYCRKGGFAGKPKTYHTRAYVLDSASNAVWGMQFVWPFKADYRVVYLHDDYHLTVIGRNKRDYVWIMARTPRIPDDEFDAALALIERLSYDISKIQKVPQHWEKKPNV